MKHGAKYSKLSPNFGYFGLFVLYDFEILIINLLFLANVKDLDQCEPCEDEFVTLGNLVKHLK
jgi:hypothetical protein